MGTCQQCGSWSVSGHNHKKVTGQDPICASSCLTILGVEYWVWRCKLWTWMLKDIRIHRPIWTSFNDLLPLYDVQKEVQHCWSLVAMRAVWVAGSLKSDTLHYEVGRRWDLCNWILDSSILRLSCIELRLTCSGCLRWHPIKYQRVSQSGCSCSLASLHYVTGVPCMRVRSKFTPRYTGQGSCFRRWPFMWTFSSWSDLLLCRWKTLVKVLDMQGFRRHSW